MNIPNAGSQHRHTKIGDHLALIWIGTLTGAHDPVFFSPDGADLRLDGHSLLPADSNQFFCLLDIFLNGIMGAVKHNRGKACLNTCFRALIAAVIQMQGNRDCDIEFLQHAVHHTNDCLVTAHILAGALRHTKDNR